jgi:hypothetical protein
VCRSQQRNKFTKHLHLLQAQLGGGLMSAYGLSKLFAGGGLAGLGVYNLGRE